MSPSRRTDDAQDTQHSSPPDPSAGERRTRSRLRRFDQVYRAALDLFIEQGFSGTTMEQIADRADVARATVFNYFPRKTAFLDEWTARRRAQAASVLGTDDVKDWALDEALHRYMGEMARISEKAPDETRALLSATLQQTNFLAHPALATQLSEIIRSAQVTPGWHLNGHVDQAGLILATSYFAVLDQWISADPPEFDLLEQLQVTVNIVLYGIASRPAPRKVRRASS